MLFNSIALTIHYQRSYALGTSTEQSIYECIIRSIDRDLIIRRNYSCALNIVKIRL